jgi:hypothetical protein
MTQALYAHMNNKRKKSKRKKKYTSTLPTGDTAINQMTH